jgi:glyoxylase-like metal-dependent hydrolase (beta-lactamase superfamily II)
LELKQTRIGVDNFSYIIYSKKNAIIIDPGFEPKKIIDFIKSHDLTIKYIIVTHHHSDHTYGINILKSEYPNSQIVASKNDGIKIDANTEILVNDGDELKLDDIYLSFILTPGHTPGGICIIVNDSALLTGDTLFIGDCGRTDLPGGNLRTMYNTLHNIIMKLPDYLIVYPGHDYGDKPFDTLGNQKRFNKTLNVKNFEDFSKIY